MIIDRPQLKQRARGIIQSSNPKVIYASIIFVALSALTGFLSSRLTGVSFNTLQRYQEYLMEGSMDYAASYLLSQAPAPAAQLIDSALQIVMLIVGVGFTVFVFNTVRGTGAVYGNLLDGFGPYIRVVLLNVVTALFAALWSLLLVVPGIVAAYSYSMASYLMLDHPDWGILQCIRESKRLTKGYKGQLFALDLSFLGYILLSAIPVVGYIAQVWLQPYRETSRILFYDTLRQQDGEPYPV